MSYGLLEIDHLLTAVDLDESESAYERLGFTLTPISVITDIGVANRLALFRPLTPGAANFIELMDVIDESRAVGTAMGELLSGSPGIRSMVLCSPDAQHSYATLARDGFGFSAPIDIERQWELPDGEVLQPSFRVTLPIDAPLRFNFVQYRTLHYYVRPAWLEHENGAMHLTRVFALSSDPQSAIRYFERVFGAQARLVRGLHQVGAGRCLLSIGDREALSLQLPQRWLSSANPAPMYVGFEIQVRSLSSLATLLSRRSIDCVRLGQALLVGPDRGCGNIIRFVES